MSEKRLERPDSVPVTVPRANMSRRFFVAAGASTFLFAVSRILNAAPKAETRRGIPRVGQTGTEGSLGKVLPLMEGLTIESIDASRETVLAHIKWAKEVQDEYEWIMDMKDSTCQKGLREIKIAIRGLNKVLKTLNGHRRGLVELAQTKERVLKARADEARVQNIIDTYVQKVEPARFTEHTHVLYASANQMDSIPRGHVWSGGVAKPIEAVLDVKFKYEGDTELQPRAARAVVELARDLRKNKMPGVRITEGFDLDGDALTAKHESRGHKEGYAFDWTPINREFEPDNVCKVMGLSYTSDYYDIRFEPDGNPENIREQVAEYLVQNLNVSHIEAAKFAKKRVGDGRYTKGKHFHTEAKGGSSKRLSDGPLAMAA